MEQVRVERGRVEVGPILGGHLFSDDLELGVADEPRDSSSPLSGPLLGVRLGVRATRWISVEAEGTTVISEDRYFDDRVMVFGVRGHVLVHIAPPDVRARPFLVAGAGMLASSGEGNDMNHVGDDVDFAPHWGAGLRVDVSQRVALRLDVRHVLAPNTGEGSFSSDLEGHLGVAFALGGSTERNTLIFERVVEKEPPPPPKDTDDDGLTDDRDGCPREAEDKDGWVDADGCPELDNDLDGVVDEIDICPIEAELKNDIDDEDGCPEIDADQDAFFGSADRCPTDPEDKDGFEDGDGCPDRDDDQDGVADATDQCADKKETPNGWKDDDGCPDELPREVKKFTGVIAGISFKKNSDKIERKSNRLLTRAAKVMKDYPDLKIEIVGHTSDEGDRDYNIDLSLRRAEAVKAYLVGQGVAGERITTSGKGPDEPIAKGTSRRARAKNRRIEFHLK